MKKSIYTLFSLFILISLSSCSTALEEYSQEDGNFDIKEYFTGNVVARGVIQDYSSKVNRRFCVDIEGTWQGSEGLLAEKFYFDDGEISYRNWQLSKHPDGSYQGTAEDVVGTAIGKHQGFAFQFQYQLSLVIDDTTYQVEMDDWMYQLNDSHVLNKTVMRKLGVKVAEVTLFFDKSLPEKQCDNQSGMQVNN